MSLYLEICGDKVATGIFANRATSLQTMLRHYVIMCSDAVDLTHCACLEGEVEEWETGTYVVASLLRPGVFQQNVEAFVEAQNPHLTCMITQLIGRN